MNYYILGIERQFSLCEQYMIISFTLFISHSLTRSIKAPAPGLIVTCTLFIFIRECFGWQAKYLVDNKEGDLKEKMNARVYVGETYEIFEKNVTEIL